LPLKNAMATKSLKALGHQLAQTQKQLDLLQSGPFKEGELPAHGEWKEYPCWQAVYKK